MLSYTPEHPIVLCSAGLITCIDNLDRIIKPTYFAGLECRSYVCDFVNVLDSFSESIVLRDKNPIDLLFR